ncbi:hypothetical protein OIO90_006031 [Microbotryomycetes sp. JL221]|nr:hypothetical protein OIO90_006031 [Microbotryomycetes sp. JL221]
MQDSQAGKAKPGRTRAACSACRAVKQKCDGAASKGLACRRCQVYNLECDYDGVPVPPRSSSSSSHQSTAGQSSSHSAKPTLAPATSSHSSILTQQVRSSANEGAPSINVPNFFPSGAMSHDTATAAALREITERLRHIESDLAFIKSTTSINNSIRAATQSNHSDYASPEVSSSSAPQAMDLPADTHPLQVLEHTVDQIERLQVTSQSPEWNNDSEHAPVSELGTIEPDAIVRGLVTVADAEAAFSFFFERIHPWLPVVDDTVYREPLVAQARSPFLFHVILLITNFYNTSPTKRAQEVYRGLTEIILAAEMSKINVDFIRGMLVLIYYKPVQHVAFWSRGVESISRMVHLSKVNALSSIMIHSFVHRCADLIGMHRAPDRFLSAAGDPSMLQPALEEIRVLIWLNVADIHGSLQSGRFQNNDPGFAMKATKLIAEMKMKACDVRSAGALEVYAIATAPKNIDPSKYRLDNLNKINEQIDAWHRYWQPRLADAQRTVDPLAYATVQNMAAFVEYTVNGAVFTRWFADRAKSLQAGGNGRPVLTADDWSFLGRAVQAAQRTVFSTSKEAAADNSPLRTAPWPNAIGSEYAPLTVDPTVVDNFRTALDTMTCITFISSLILLVRLCSSGLVSCDFELRQREYEAGLALTVAPTSTPNHKMRRLLELGSTFLYAVAPNKLHPARKHALVAQMILRAGFSGEQQSAQPTTAGGKQSTEAGSQQNGLNPAATSPIVQALNGSPIAFKSPQSAPLHSPGSASANEASPSTAAAVSQHQQQNGWATSMPSVSMPSLSMSEDRSAFIISTQSSSAMDMSDSKVGDEATNTTSRGATGLDGSGDPTFGQSPPSFALASVLSGDNPFFGQYFSAEQNGIPGLGNNSGLMSMLDDLEDTIDWQAMS